MTPGAREDEASMLRRALSWAYAETVGRMVMTLVVSLLLARLLGPESFGVIAMANVYVFFIEMLLRQGLVAAIIQRPHLTTAHLDTAFWMILGALGLLIPVSLLLSGWWASVNRVPELEGVIVGLTPVLLLKGLSVVQESRFRRELDYRALALRRNLAVLAGGVAGIILALLGFGVTALVGQQLVLSAVELVVLWRLSDWRPRFRLDRACASDLLGFSSMSALAGLGVFVQQRIDALLIGLVFGPAAVGLYRLAVRLTEMVVEGAGGALQSVSLPALSRLNRGEGALNDGVHNLLHLSSILTIPVIGTLAVVSGPLLTLLGPEWAPAVRALEILCVAAVLQVPAALTGPILQSAGLPGVLAAMSWVSGLLSGAAFVGVGLLLGSSSATTQVTGLALARVVSLVTLMAVLVLPWLHRRMGLRPRTLAAAVLPMAGAVGVTSTGLIALRELLDLTDVVGAAGAFVVSGLVGVGAVGGIALAIDSRARHLLATLMRRMPWARPVTEGPVTASVADRQA